MYLCVNDFCQIMPSANIQLLYQLNCLVEYCISPKFHTTKLFSCYRCA